MLPGLLPLLDYDRLDTETCPACVRETDDGTLELTADEREAVARALRSMIAADRFPLAPRLQPLKSALAKLDPPAAPPVEPLPPPIAWVNSTIGQRKRRR